MIVLDILHNIFEILPELILGAGPFCVFKGMGDGKDSGKLIFKKIYTGSGITITEDSTSLDITSSGIGGSIPVDNREIAFGNSTNNGLTSSTFKFCSYTLFGTEQSLVGLSILGGYNHFNCSGIAVENKDSIIVGGSGSYIDKNVCNSIIVGGQLNCIIGFTRNCESSIIGGSENTLETSNFSVILGSNTSLLQCSISSSILNSSSTSLYKSLNSSLILSDQGIVRFSTQSTNFGSGNFLCLNRSTFVNGRDSSITASCFSSIINGEQNKLSRSETSTIINGYCNFLNFQNNSTILNGYKNCVTSIEVFRGIGNTIVNGKYNCIYNYDGAPSANRPYRTRYDTILNGECNRIYWPSCRSTIINGYKNCICISNATIIGGKGNSHAALNVSNTSNSTIIYGKYSEVCSANSTIFSIDGDVTGHPTLGGGNNNSIIQLGWGYQFGKYNSYILSAVGSNNSIISSVGKGHKIYVGIDNSLNRNCNNSIINVQSINCDLPVNIIGSFTFSKNYTFGVSFSNFNNSIIAWGSSMSSLRGSTSNLPGRGVTISESSIIGGELHNIYAACDSVILGGCQNLIIEGCRSAIIGGYKNYLAGFANDSTNQPLKGVVNSVIIGGQNNCLKTVKPVCNSVIIGGQNIVEQGSSTVRVQNMALYSRLAYYNFATQTKSTGVNGSKTTITTLTVCNGIIVSWG